MKTLFPAKTLVFVLALLPLCLMIWDGWQDQLGANPIEELSRRSGAWTLRFLLLTLCVSPLSRFWSKAWLMRFRRMLGLFTFFYACLHFLNWLVLDQFFFWPEIIKDVVKRPYITVGFSAYLILIPLALTSTRAMMRRLGRRWSQLHKAVYVCALLALIHYFWLTKADYFWPVVHGLILFVLFGMRMVIRYKQAQHKRQV